VERSDPDVEFFELAADGGQLDDGPPGVVDGRRPPLRRWARRLAPVAAGLLIAGLLAVAIVGHHRPEPGSPDLDDAIAPVAVAPGPVALPSWIDVFAAPQSRLASPAIPTPDQHCPAGSAYVALASTTRLGATIVDHLGGFVVDRATRIVNEHGALCTAYAQAHNDGGVVLWLVASAAPLTGTDPGIAQLDYGPAYRQVHSVTVVNSDRSTVSVLVQGPDPTLPTSGDISRLAADPAVRN
jgi:hypothetical protein